MKKVFALVLAAVITITAIVGGTIAYFMDTDQDVNVATLGNVKIEQLEYERVVDENGNWVEAPEYETTFSSGTYIPDLMQEYTQFKPLYPAVFANEDDKVIWDDRNEDEGRDHQQSWAQIGAPGSNQLFDDSVKNVLDKFVFVENTGKGDAYVRTWFAFELGDLTIEEFNDVIHTNINSGTNWAWGTDDDWKAEEIDGNKYAVKCVPYTRNNGILKAGEISRPSLLQIYMDPEATNEDAELIDGNGNGLYDVLVFSQAIQVAGMDNAEQALTAGFGTNHPWAITKEQAAATEPIANEDGTLSIYTTEQLLAFAEDVNSGNNYAGKTVKLEADVNLAGKTWTPIGTDDTYFSGIFDGQGHTVWYMNAVGNEGVGFFGNLFPSATVKNLNVKNATVNGNHWVGGIVGHSYGSIINCTVEDSTITATPSKLETENAGTTTFAMNKTMFMLENTTEETKYTNGDKAGGIVGWIGDGNYVVEGCTVKNTTVKAFRDVGGLVGIAVDGATVTDNAVENVILGFVSCDNVGEYESGKWVADTAANLNVLVGRENPGSVIKNNTVDGKVIAAGEKVAATIVANNAASIDEAKNGNDIIIEEDLTFSAGDTTSNSSYGSTGVTVNGGVLDANGNTITVNDANGTWDCAVNPEAGTVKNATINGAFRGIFMSGATGDVYIDNVIIDKVCYTFNSDDGNKDYGVYISNSTLNGWTSYSDVHKEVVFTNCNFGQGTGGYKYAFCRPYNASVFENCVFEEGFEFDTSKTSDIVFKNCYYGDTLITAENAATLAKGDVVFFYNGLNGITIQ